MTCEMSGGGGRRSARGYRTSCGAGAYRLGPVRRIHHGDKTIDVWSALYVLVLKATAIVLAGLVPPHAHADLDLLAPLRSW